MQTNTARWALATLVLLVWAGAILADILSTSYSIDTGFHVGCGAILGVLLGTGVLKSGGNGPSGGDKP